MSGTRKHDLITPVLRDPRWFPIKKKHLFFRDAVMAFKYMTRQAPFYHSDQFTTRIAITGRVTRKCHLLNIPLSSQVPVRDLFIVAWCTFGTI